MSAIKGVPEIFPNPRYINMNISLEDNFVSSAAIKKLKSVQ